MTEYSSPLMAVHGAVELDEPHGLDAAGVAWHYGDPLGEQRAIHEGAAVVDRSQRAVLSVAGPDAPTFLNNILSQKLDDVTDGYSASALDLDMQGHMLHHADVTKVGDVYYLDVPAGQRESFADFLRKMVFWSEVTVEETDLGVLTVLGDAQVPGGLDAAFVREVGWPGVRRQDVAVPREALRGAVDTLGLPLAGLMAFTAERVRALEPELGVDLDDKAIPHEAPTLIGRGERPGAVHLNKGCYRGQETVARVENLGRSPRLIVLLHLDGSAPTEPRPGADVLSGTRRVGRLGTVVHDYEYGPIALGLVKRSALDAGDLTAGGVAAAVDRDSVAVDESGRAGRAAIDRLRSGRD